MRDNEIELSLDVKDGQVLVKDHNEILITFPLAQFRTMMEASSQKSLSDDELAEMLKKHNAVLDVEASFSAEEETDSGYGADADGNRGISRTEVLDVEPRDLDLEVLKMELFDEDGNNLGGDGNPTDLLPLVGGDKKHPLFQFVLQKINDNLESYLDDN